MADWIEGYRIAKEGRGEGLYSPSGEKIAGIQRSRYAWWVSTVSPELKDMGFAQLRSGEYSSVEHACQTLVVAHAKGFRVVRQSDVTDAAALIASALVEAQARISITGDNNAVQTGDNNAVTITPAQAAEVVQKAGPSKVIDFLTKDLPSAIVSGSVGAAFTRLLS